jgi:hypothetical protein
MLGMLAHRMHARKVMTYKYGQAVIHELIAKMDVGKFKVVWVTLSIASTIPGTCEVTFPEPAATVLRLFR